MRLLTKLIAAVFITSASVSYATTANNQLYGAIQGGIFQTKFNSSYVDQTDIIPQNVSDSFSQDGYTSGLAIGYTHLINPRYFVDVELAGNIDGNSALYQSGSASTAFSDKVELNRHVDLTFAPGIMTQSGFSPYLKLGISYASIHDYLTSPVGFNPVMTQYNTNKNISGFVAGLGVRYGVNDHVKLFAEANYHDYGTLNFSSFQNFSANYAHSARIYSYAVVVGAMYAFNV